MGPTWGPYETGRTKEAGGGGGGGGGGGYVGTMNLAIWVFFGMHLLYIKCVIAK